MPIKLTENFRAVFYAPFYATQALGFYAREGVEVELRPSPAPAAAAADLLDGTNRPLMGWADARHEGAGRQPELVPRLLLRSRRPRSRSTLMVCSQPSRRQKSAGISS
jgi:hypothetical protein